MLNLSIHSSAQLASAAAADHLAELLASSDTHNIMVAAGNTPLPLYGHIAARRLPLQRLNIFALDDYVGVPPADPRNCANLLRRSVVDAWGIPSAQFFTVSSLEADATASVREHERRIIAMGGLDVVVLGLGQNGHLGFNEPGSAETATGRIVELGPSSVEANRTWFGGDYAPSQGVTVGLKIILAARHILLLAFGPHKAAAVKAMIDGPRDARCPASFLQARPNVLVFLDEPAAASLHAR